MWFFSRNLLRIGPRTAVMAFVLFMIVQPKTVLGWYNGYFESLGSQIRVERKDEEGRGFSPVPEPLLNAGIDPRTGKPVEIEMISKQIALDAQGKLQRRIAELEEENERYVQQTIKAMDSEHAMGLALDELAEKVERAFSIVVMTRETVTFRGGYTYRVGEIIDWGPFKDEKIEQIDYKRRTVRFGSGVVARISRFSGNTSGGGLGDWLSKYNVTRRGESSGKGSSSGVSKSLPKTNGKQGNG